MRLLAQKSEVKNSFLIFGGGFVVIVALALLYWCDILTNLQWAAIISGLLTGFVVAFIQLLLSWRELQIMDKYAALKIEEILPRRNDKGYYMNLISKAQKKIMVQGVTAQRFLHDFANKENSEEGAKILLEALGRGIEVKILVTSIQYLTDENDKKKALMAKSHLSSLSSEFPKYFNYAYFDHLPAHSILTVDDESIVGPVFPKVVLIRKRNSLLRKG